jgi:NAD(P)H-hydrate epimerase
MARIDGRTQAEFAIPGTLLMEDAGVKSWAAVRRQVWDGRKPRGRLVFLAGKGNNGGDAFVMARQAAVERTGPLTIILAAGRPAAGADPALMLAGCEALGIECLSWPEQADAVMARMADASWVFDGVAGTGIRGPLRPPIADLLAAVNSRGVRTIAIDVPSGVGDGYRADHPALRADVTLTMGLPKLCLYLPRARSLCGRILVIPVGFPPALLDDPGIPGELVPLRAWKTLLPHIPADTHKNRRGHLAVFAGSRGTTGAAWLCATAAARSRLGLVTLFADADSYPVIAPRLTSIMCRPWEGPSTEMGRPWGPKGFSGVLAGPGWGLTESRAQWLDTLISLPVSGVMDADALTLLGRAAEQRAIDLGGRWVLTPHPAEFSRLSGDDREAVLDDPVDHALSLSARLNAVIVLKGHCTVVATPEGRYGILDAGNAALATGGSGDVLAGIIAAGIAGGMTPAHAAWFGVSLHAHVGRVAARRMGWFLAEDLVPLISRVLWQ